MMDCSRIRSTWCAGLCAVCRPPSCRHGLARHACRWHGPMWCSAANWRRPADPGTAGGGATDGCRSAACGVTITHAHTPARCAQASTSPTMTGCTTTRHGSWGWCWMNPALSKHHTGKDAAGPCWMHSAARPTDCAQRQPQHRTIGQNFGTPLSSWASARGQKCWQSSSCTTAATRRHGASPQTMRGKSSGAGWLRGVSCCAAPLTLGTMHRPTTCRRCLYQQTR